MKRLLITGALGHIGSRLIRTLAAGDFDDVVLFDNLATQRYCSLFDLPAGVRFRFVEGDVCTSELDPWFDGIDCVVHLAALTDATASFQAQDQVERINHDGARRVAAACARTGSRLLFVSTTSVYGTRTDTAHEDQANLQPQSPYAASKLRAEQTLLALGAGDGLRCFIGRFGTIYGTSPGMRFHTAINNFCWQAATGRPLTVWRTAMDQFRPYLELTDAVRAIRHVIDADLFDNRVYNVLTQNATVRQIVDVIRAEIPDTNVQYVDAEIMNQLSFKVSSDRFASTGFRAAGSLESGIAETLRLIRGISYASRAAVALSNGG